jgi:hypothetical protein
MHYVELLKANNINFRIKFINILKDESAFEAIELSRIYDTLLDSKKVRIEFNINGTESLNKMVLELMELNINVGNSSFHEEEKNR